jgi:hypothetical protein
MGRSHILNWTTSTVAVEVAAALEFWKVSGVVELRV